MIHNKQTTKDKKKQQKIALKFSELIRIEKKKIKKENERIKQTETKNRNKLQNSSKFTFKIGSELQPQK